MREVQHFRNNVKKTTKKILKHKEMKAIEKTFGSHACETLLTIKNKLTFKQN